MYEKRKNYITKKIIPRLPPDASAQTGGLFCGPRTRGFNKRRTNRFRRRPLCSARDNACVLGVNYRSEKNTVIRIEACRPMNMSKLRAQARRTEYRLSVPYIICGGAYGDTHGITAPQCAERISTGATRFACRPLALFFRGAE